MKKIAVVLSCGIFSALLCVPSFAVSDSEPLDSSYVIQNDVSVLSVPPVQTFATGTEKVLHGGTMPGTGNYFSYYTLKGLSDTVLQDAFNDNARETSNELYDLSVEVNSLKSSVSSALTQGQFEASMDRYWEFFDVPYLYQDGTIKQTTAESLTPKDWLRVGLMGLASKMGLGFPDGRSLFGYNIGSATSNIWSNNSGYVMRYAKDGSEAYESMSFYKAYNMLLDSVSRPVGSYLGSDGLNRNDFRTYTAIDSLQLSSLGLARILRGSSGAIVGASFINSSDLSSTEYKTDNLLNAFYPLWWIQNDLARLTHVIADPTEQALHDATKDNVQSVTDNLTGEKGVTSQDIGDLSGISSGVGDFMATGVSPDRLTGSISDEGNYSFFSQQTADDLHTFPAPQSADDDFIDFYAINRQEYSSLLGGDTDG